MNEKHQKARGLGRGLSALMADIEHPNSTGMPVNESTSVLDRLMPIDMIEPNPDQPRKTFSDDALAELADSIRQKGVLQPLIVRVSPRNPDRYEIVAGERRWRAAQIAQLHVLPVLIRSFTDTEVLEIAIIENIQRADLNAIEEATGYRQLMDKFGHTQEHLAQALGKSRSHIANLLRLLTLPEEVKVYLRDNQLTQGHARALVTVANPSDVAHKIIQQNLSVREAERLVKSIKAKKNQVTSAAPEPGPKGKDADTRSLELDLSAQLGMSVTIEHKEISGGGQMVIKYRSIDQLDELCVLLSAIAP